MFRIQIIQQIVLNFETLKTLQKEDTPVPSYELCDFYSLTDIPSTNYMVCNTSAYHQSPRRANPILLCSEVASSAR